MPEKRVTEHHECDLPDVAITEARQEHQVELERNTAPIITIDDLREPPMTIERKLQHRGPRWYHAKAEQGDVKALITLRPYLDVRYPGAYILDESTDRVDELAPGRMGKKQEARARALLIPLREQVEAALLASGWEKRWTTAYGKDLWLYVGDPAQPASAPVPEIRERDLPDIALVGTDAEIAGKDQAREVALADQVQSRQPDFELEDRPAPELRQSHIVEVVGSAEAKARGQQPAYSREVWTRPITFTCIVCGETVTQERYPGHKPLYCSDGCKEDRQRERTRERVAKHRQEKKKKAALESQQSANEG